MNKSTIALLSVVAFVAGFLIFYQNRPTAEKAPASPVATSTATWEAKIDDQANVNVVITPLDLGAQSAEWKFDVGMNTHSVELDQDMTQIAVLIDDRGREHKPIRWDGPVGGHHREGTLTFNRISPTPKSIELKITGIADTVRSFVWNP